MLPSSSADGRDCKRTGGGVDGGDTEVSDRVDQWTQSMPGMGDGDREGRVCVGGWGRGRGGQRVVVVVGGGKRERKLISVLETQR